MTKGNLLLVDDEPLILKGLIYSLSSYADKVFTAENGKEALALIKEHEIHCILSDISMPVMSGVELIKAVRGLQNNVPFIFFTAHGSKDLMMEVAKFGAFDFLDKPYFDGIEEVVQRGLLFGMNKSLSNPDFISEYQTLLKDIK